MHQLVINANELIAHSLPRELFRLREATFCESLAQRWIDGEAAHRVRYFVNMIRVDEDGIITSNFRCGCF